MGKTTLSQTKLQRQHRTANLSVYTCTYIPQQGEIIFNAVNSKILQFQIRFEVVQHAVALEQFEEWGNHQGLGVRSNGFGTHPRTIRDWESDLMGLGPTQGPSGTGSQI